MLCPCGTRLNVIDVETGAQRSLQQVSSGLLGVPGAFYRRSQEPEPAGRAGLVLKADRQRLCCP